MRGDDRGNLIALEGMIVALILLAAIYATMTTTQSTTDSTYSRRELQTMTSDVLVVLAGLQESRGRVLDVSLAEALDCVDGAIPSTNYCDGVRPTNLSYRLEGYLPPGAGYSVSLDNGVEVRTLFTQTGTGGERVSTSHAFTPDWNLTFATTDFSCYESTMTVNATLVPLWHADTPNPRYIDAEAAGATTNATASTDGTLWNATLPPTAIGEAVHARVNASRGTYEGMTQTSACDLGGAGWTLRNALNMSIATVLDADGDSTVPIGNDVAFAYDFRAIESLVAGATLTRVDATVYAPVPGRPSVADAYVVADTIELGNDWSGGATWSTPHTSLFGHHPIVVTAELSVPDSSGGTTTVEVQLVNVLTIALSSGVVPIDPPYRAVLEVWMPDWG